MEWKSTISKWDDEENYEIKEPLWKQMLRVAAKHGDITSLQETLLWLHNKNMTGDSIRIKIIGYYLCQLHVDLEKELSFSKQEVIDIINFSNQFETIDECTVYVMKELNIAKELIDEYKNR